jgi:hypothetical protein
MVVIKMFESLCRKYQNYCVISIGRLSLIKFYYLFFRVMKLSKIILEHIINNSDYEIIRKIVDDLEILGYVPKKFSCFTLTTSGYEVGTIELTKKSRFC